MSALMTALLWSGCAPTITCVAHEGSGELPAARTVEIPALTVEAASTVRNSSPASVRSAKRRWRA